MKILSFVIASFVLSTTAFAVDIADIAGRYRISRPGSATVQILRVEGTGAVYLTERSPAGKLECWGSAQMVQNTLESAFACENGRVLEHKIYFSGARIFMDRFTARVFSSGDGRTRLMNFQKLANVLPEAI